MLVILEPDPPGNGPILVCDAANNDVAEFFHSEQATVSQSYETALAYAKGLVATNDLLFALRQAIIIIKNCAEGECEEDQTYLDVQVSRMEEILAKATGTAVISSPADTAMRSA